MNQSLFNVDIYKISYPNLQEVVDLCDSDYVRSIPYDTYYSKFLDAENETTVKSNLFHWKKDNQPQAHAHPVFADICKFVETHAKIYWDSIDYFPETLPKIFQSWINISDTNSSFPMHNHGLAGLSAVLYLNASSNQGNIVFESPFELVLGQIPYLHTRKNLTQEVDISTGDLVIFPGWLKHKVKPNLTNTPRIAFVMNLNGSGSAVSGYTNNSYK
jgi:uncharacterized protein (TIGR02466 family)